MSLYLQRQVFVFNKTVQYRHLVSVFPDIVKLMIPLLEFRLNYIGLKVVPDEEELELQERLIECFIRKNLSDLELNKKPEGITSGKPSVKLVFPVTDDNRVKFCIYAMNGEHDLIGNLSTKIHSLLYKKGYKFKLNTDIITLDNNKERATAQNWWKNR